MKLVFVRESHTTFSLEELSNFHKEATESVEDVIAPKDAMEIRIQYEEDGSPKKTDVILFVKLVSISKNKEVTNEMRDVWINIGEHFGWKYRGIVKDNCPESENIDAVIVNDDWI